MEELEAASEAAGGTESAGTGEAFARSSRQWVLKGGNTEERQRWRETGLQQQQEQQELQRRRVSQERAQRWRDKKEAGVEGKKEEVESRVQGAAAVDPKADQEEEAKEGLGKEATQDRSRSDDE